MTTLHTPASELPAPSEILEQLDLAAKGIVTLAGLDDARWEAILIAVTKRGVVTPADRRAATALRKAIADELQLV